MRDPWGDGNVLCPEVSFIINILVVHAVNIILEFCKMLLPSGEMG